MSDWQSWEKEKIDTIFFIGYYGDFLETYMGM